MCQSFSANSDKMQLANYSIIDFLSVGSYFMNTTVFTQIK